MSATQPLERGATFDLQGLAAALRTEAAYVSEGHTARTLVREADVRVVLVVLRSGNRIAAHAAEDTASVHALSGHLRLHLDGARTVELQIGGLLVMPPHERHDVEALEDSAFLLTLGWRASR